MSLSKLTKIARSETKISALFPITHLNSPSIFESQSGFMGSVIKIAGIAFELEDTAKLNYQQFLLHQALLGLGEQFIIYVTTHRKKSPCVLNGKFNSLFAMALNEHYHQRFQNHDLYTNDLYITVVLKGDTSSKAASILTKVKSYLSHQVMDMREQYREREIAALTKAVDQLCSNLSSFGAHLLGIKDEELGYSELTHFLSLWVNAGKSLPYQKPIYGTPIANHLPQTFKSEAIYPNGHLGQYLSRYQILFGEAIQFQGNTVDDVCFGAMLSLKKYPTATAYSLLDPLLSLDCEYIATHTFAPSPKDAGLKTIMQKRSKLISAGDKALSQIETLEVLEDEVASEDVYLGLHHHTLMLLSDSREKLNHAILEISKQYATVGIAVIKEALGMEPAFWSQIPCNHHLITRASLITSLNFVDFCPLHNLQSGVKNENFLGEAVTLCETPARTPVFFNYHSKGSKTNPSKGHTAVFGGNNAGKTTLVNFLDAQMGRYNNRSFYIDRDESSKIYILASGNSCYIKIAPGAKIAMNPLMLQDTPENRSFLKSWFGALIIEPSEISLPSQITEIVNDCIDYAFDALAPEFRTLSNVSKFLPMNFPRWPHLRQWLKNDGNNTDGEFHWLFDNEADSLDFNFDKVGFDVTYLMDCIAPTIASPVYLYLVHRMRQCLDGRLTSFVIDEAWQLFASPFWEKCLKEWLPTIRKKNGHFIFMTQSAKTVTSSAINHVVLDNLATMIVFPNPMAERETYIEHLKLREAEYQAIKDNTPESRIFLYKQEQKSMLCKLDLNGLQEFIRVLSGNTQSVKLLNEIMAKAGNAPDVWLPEFFERSSG
ncbi:VirB4 family type IV secretion/conjugal transfer ATPase [Legionella impletisoli]|uniref:CagE TrbE VirB component of type IV transporter system central domain-containing protein n=1 Tax=Legionella impletisoli TaxID=343510 RepID=A0A917JT17_9GAMM|nr:VirB4 family type IV secretion/conjugal transfer ATPase [Legionella impletisoli]GGI82601.1 hypothetical protein GCM10007966_09040 [Legionella impletisoli]